MPTSRVGLTDAIVTAIEPPEMSELFVCDSVCAGRAVRVGLRGSGAAEVSAFMTWLADEREVAPANHWQASSVLLFVYRDAQADR